MKLALLVVAACGGSPSRELVVVAHQDDDMLFMQPALFERVAAHEPLTVVYVTAGDAGEGLVRSRARATAARYAYTAVAGSLDDVELVFLDYPDGGVLGDAPASLLRLWEGSIASATTIAESPVTFDREGLIDRVAAIIEERRPSAIHTLEIAGTHGDDHSDHMLVGALAQLALARTTSDAQLVAHRGYNVTAEPANLDDRTFANASLMMRAYLACMTTCGECGVTPCDRVDDDRYTALLHRQYAISMQTVRGTLCSDAGCIGEVELGADGLVHAGAQCLEVAADRSIVRGACTRDPRRHFALDSEGHLWSGIAPDPAPGMLFDHGSCVFLEGGSLRVGLCGPAHDVRWTLR